MIDVLLVATGPLAIAVGVLVTVGALLSRFGVRTSAPPAWISVPNSWR
jgi:hypothetical protein